MKVEIAIIGGGFCGITTAMNILSKDHSRRTRIHIINAGSPTGRGIAYTPTSAEHLLNVTVEKMSCLSDNPDHFLNWVMSQNAYALLDRDMVKKFFLPRRVYGNYLLETWNEYLVKYAGRIFTIEDYAHDVIKTDLGYRVQLMTGTDLLADAVILANGNEVPANPKIANQDIYNSPNYFRNPWNPAAFENVNPHRNVLIIGNGLTMVDAVMELEKPSFKGKIYTVSPHGFAILPHRHNGVVYKAFAEEIKDIYDLNIIFSAFKKHLHALRRFGISAEPLIDSLRSRTQQLWMTFTEDEKRRFLTHLRHLWGVARHRIPTHIHDRLTNMRLSDKLHIQKGKLLAMEEKNEMIEVRYADTARGIEHIIYVDRIINCSGPSLDISKSTNPLIKRLFLKGMITQDQFRMGLETNLTGEIINVKGDVQKGLFTLGGNLRGLLWESTAVPELKTQSANLAEQIALIFGLAEESMYTEKIALSNTLDHG